MTDNDPAIAQLESRLQRGWELIDQAEQSADRRAASRYTRRWLDLLDEYERLAKSHPRDNSDTQTG